MGDMKLVNQTDSIDFHASKDVLEKFSCVSAYEISHFVLKTFLGHLYITITKASAVEGIKVDFSIPAKLKDVVKKRTILINWFELAKKSQSYKLCSGCNCMVERDKSFVKWNSCVMKKELEIAK